MALRALRDRPRIVYPPSMQQLLLAASARLPGPFRRAATPARVELVAQFMKFGLVGVAGFLVDTAVVYATRPALGLYGAGLLSYLVAASANWALNRAWTFRGRAAGGAFAQWSRAIGSNLAGFALNRGAYVVLVTVSTVCAEAPVLAIAAGAVAGMFANFAVSRAYVFR